MLFPEQADMHQTNGPLEYQSSVFLFHFYKMEKLNDLKCLKLVSALAQSWPKPLASEKLREWLRSCKALTARCAEPCFIKAFKRHLVQIERYDGLVQHV